MKKKKIAIIGCGLIGSSWATIFSKSGFEVSIYEKNLKVRSNILNKIKTNLKQLKVNGLFKDDINKVIKNISIVGSLEGSVDGAFYIQENTIENLEQKIKIFKILERIVDHNTILASSTSTFKASKFSATLKTRHRCIVVHPVNPPHLIPLVEIAPSKWTSEDVIKKTKYIQKKSNQVPIVLKKEIDGFVLNRLQALVLYESWRLVAQGIVDVDDLDKTMRDGLGLRWAFMGPFETINLNAKGGIKEYAITFGKKYYDLIKPIKYRPWNSKIIGLIGKKFSKIGSKVSTNFLIKKRDKSIMKLLNLKRILK